MERNDEPRLAVLIDADNTTPKWAEAIFEEIATLGEASVRRIYGDFSGPHLRSWEKKLAGLAVIPHQQFAYTKLSVIRSHVRAANPEFDPRTYGCTRLVDLMEKTGQFQVKRNEVPVRARMKRLK